MTELSMYSKFSRKQKLFYLARRKDVTRLTFIQHISLKKVKENQETSLCSMFFFGTKQKGSGMKNCKTESNRTSAPEEKKKTPLL